MKRNEIPDTLWNEMKKTINSYSELVKEVDEMIFQEGNKTGFFPGYRGLWLEEESETIPNILVLGQDFGNVETYEKMKRGETNDLKAPTWKNMRELFKSANIPLKHCFFSNVFMGLRKSKRMAGNFPGFKEEKFLSQNLKFLKFQIEFIKPKVLITLGKPANLILSMIENSEIPNWDKSKNLNYKDLKIKIDAKEYNYVMLLHPSYRKRWINKISRNYMTSSEDILKGNEAEVQMLKDAIQGI